MLNAENGPFNYSVLHIISGDVWAGAEVQLVTLVKHLHRHGARVTVILFNPGHLLESINAAGINTILLDERENNGLKLILGMSGALRKLNPDVIHAHGYKENIISVLANKLVHNKPVIRTIHGGQEFEPSVYSPFKYLVHITDHFILKRLQKKIISVSYPLVEILCQSINKNKITVIENQIDMQYVLDRGMDDVSESYQNNGINIACIGRLVSLKRQDIMINVVSDLIKIHNKNVYLHLYGDGPDYDKLIQIISETGLQTNIMIKNGITNIFPHLKRMDLLVIPSDHEGLPMVLLEAMTLKVPVIAHSTGGIVGVLEDGRLGTLVTRHNVPGYTESILDFCMYREKYLKKAELAFEHVKNNYDIKNNIKKYDHVYRETISMNT